MDDLLEGLESFEISQTDRECQLRQGNHIIGVRKMINFQFYQIYDLELTNIPENPSVMELIALALRDDSHVLRFDTYGAAGPDNCAKVIQKLL